MNIEIVTIGDELLLGFTIDTNAAFLARELAGLGVRVVQRTTVGDEEGAIRAAVEAALDRTGAVITTGGLGPTADDRTKPAIAGMFGRAMEMDQQVLDSLEARWRARFGHEMPASNREQAMVPERATVLPNRHGSAPGILLEDEQRRWVLMLPGVPREMRGMFVDNVLPFFRDRVGESPPVIRSRTLRTANIAESALADRLGELARGVNGLSLAFLPGNDGVDLRVTCAGRSAPDADQELAAACNAIRGKVGRYIYGEDDEDLAALTLAACAARQATVAVAESCTGGMLGMRLTAVPGASASFMGGVIAYDNSVKIRELDVSPDLLAQHGAVSEDVARAMAAGVRRRFSTNIGIAITGVAGPGGGTPEKPVGTVWVAVDLDGEIHAVRGMLPGDRAEIRWRAAQLGLDRLRRALQEDTELPAWTARG